MTTTQDLTGWLEQWAEEARLLTATERRGKALTSGKAWAGLASAFGQLAPKDCRGDLYSNHEVSSQVLTRVVGLGHIAEAWARGEDVSVAELAADLEAFACRPLPEIQTWMLLNIVLPPGADIRLGKYRLWAASAEDLRQLQALPRMAAWLPKPALDPDGILAGCTFLAVGDDPAAKHEDGGWHVSFPNLRPERPHADVLVTLQLWDLSISVHPEVFFHVEPGRATTRTWGAPNIEPVYDDRGVEVDELLTTDGYTVSAESLDAFTAFVTAVYSLIEHAKGAKTTIRRSATAATSRLLRATQRTLGGKWVDETEVQDVLLDYVTATEALLATEDVDKSRRTSQRAASLWPADFDRLRVADLVTAAYKHRSNYAHGRDDKALPTFEELEQIRETAFIVFLRWLVCVRQYGDKVGRQLDCGLLSSEIRSEISDLVGRFAQASPTPNHRVVGRFRRSSTDSQNQ
ncbi:hypothetical protein ABT185_16810 [Streptomyces clavifer]|uniref:hypothetical protein n=1 Tax=Streptomyces clavifer TaxID=68188 RepID=UPI003316F259